MFQLNNGKNKYSVYSGFQNLKNGSNGACIRFFIRKKIFFSSCGHVIYLKPTLIMKILAKFK